MTEKASTKYRRFAEELEKLEVMVEWRNFVDREAMTNKVCLSVSWDVGRAVDGYHFISQAVVKKVAGAINGMIDSAIQDQAEVVAKMRQEIER